jgi:hypothetical protein
VKVLSLVAVEIVHERYLEGDVCPTHSNTSATRRHNLLFVADKKKTRITMSLVAASRMAARPIARQAGQQRRTFLDWMTNYPDKVSK